MKGTKVKSRIEREKRESSSSLWKVTWGREKMTWGRGKTR